MQRDSAEIKTIAHVRPRDAHAAVLRVVWITLFLNLFNAIAKFIVGGLTGNMTVLADAVHATIDATNNVVGIFTLKLAYLPPDRNHPYGHRKFEAVASLAIGGMMALTSWEIFKHDLHLLWGAQGSADLQHAPVSVAFLTLVFISLLTNVFTTIFEFRRGRQYKSQFLIADAMHTRSDIFVTGLSIGSLIMAPQWPLLDVCLSLFIVYLILRSGWRVIQDNLHLLTDAVQLDPEPIRRVVENVAGVENCHAIRSHGMPDDVHLDLHIVVPENVTAKKAHEIESTVRETLRREFPQVSEVAIHHQVHQPRTEQPLRR